MALRKLFYIKHVIMICLDILKQHSNIILFFYRNRVPLHYYHMVYYTPFKIFGVSLDDHLQKYISHKNFEMQLIVDNYNSLARCYTFSWNALKSHMFQGCVLLIYAHRHRICMLVLRHLTFGKGVLRAYNIMAKSCYQSQFIPR